jgi:hypothetical protein
MDSVHILSYWAGVESPAKLIDHALCIKKAMPSPCLFPMNIGPKYVRRGLTTGRPKCYTWSGHCPFVFDKNDSTFSESNHDSNVIDSILIRFKKIVFQMRTHAKNQKLSNRLFIDNDGFLWRHYNQP